MAAGLDLRKHVLDGCLVVHVDGEIDLANSAVLQQYLVDQLDKDHAHIVVDLTGVGFLDSTALSALIVAYHAAKEMGGSLHLSGATGATRKVLVITQLDVLFDHHDHVTDAIEAALLKRDGEQPQ